jgi:alpha-1,3-rhamnosyl/mannosyltransferase
MFHYARLIRKRAIARADVVITPTEFSRSEITRLLGIPATRINVVPLCVSPVFFERTPQEHLADVREKLGLRRPMILWVGILSPRKNLLRVLRAYHQLRRQRAIEHQLIFAGRRGWHDDEVIRLAAALDPEGKDIRFIGPVDELPALYRLADLVVYPSLYEGFGLPPLEAMASGTPVVASDIPAIREVVGDAAILVEPTDEGELAAAIERALTSHELRISLIERGRERAARFTRDRMIAATLASYERLMKMEWPSKGSVTAQNGRDGLEQNPNV